MIHFFYWPCSIFNLLLKFYLKIVVLFFPPFHSKCLHIWQLIIYLFVVTFWLIAQLSLVIPLQKFLGIMSFMLPFWLLISVLGRKKVTLNRDLYKAICTNLNSLAVIAHLKKGKWIILNMYAGETTFPFWWLVLPAAPFPYAGEEMMSLHIPHRPLPLKCVLFEKWIPLLKRLMSKNTIPR